MARERSNWLVTHNGVPFAWRWALVRTPADLDPNDERLGPEPERTRRLNSPRWGAALTAAEALDSDYDAVQTSWRRIPHPVQDALLPSGSPSIANRTLSAHGLRYYLDDRGRPHPHSTRDQPREPLEPDAEVLSLSALEDLATALGHAVEVTERGTLRLIRAEPGGGGGGGNVRG